MADRKVRIVKDHLGCMTGPDESRFAGTHDDPVLANTGDVATYHGPHPNPRLDGWHLLTIDIDGTTYWLPAVEGAHFEFVTKDPETPAERAAFVRTARPVRKPPSTAWLDKLNL